MIAPYRRTPPVRAVGLIDEEGYLISEAGDRLSPGYFSPKNLRVYADRDIAEWWLRRGWGTGTLWNGILVRWHVAGHHVICLGGFPGDGPEILDGLVRLRDFLADRGAGMGSMAAASHSLLRATIDGTLWTDVGDPPPLREVIGGRQSMLAEPGYHPAFESWDLSAAYARVLGTMTYPGRWRQRETLPEAGSAFPCFVSADVTVPDQITGPLPRRARVTRPHGRWSMLFEQTRPYPTGRIRGVWSRAEIEVAASAGARVRVRAVWICEGAGRQPFASWWTEIRAARRLPGYAGTLGKVMGNALWGRFCMTGERSEVRYDDGVPVELPTTSTYREHPAFALAEHVAATVRARLYADVIAPYPAHVLAVHTDGALVAPGAMRPEGWRLKDRGEHLILLGPQAYAYMGPGGRTYKVAGVRGPDQPAVFASWVARDTGYRGNVERFDPWAGVA